MKERSRYVAKVALLLMMLVIGSASPALAGTGYAAAMVLLGPLLNSGSLFGGAFLTKSALGMLIVVALKCVVFYWKSNLKLAPAVSFMVLGNVYSTIPAMLLVIPLGGTFFSSTGNVLFIIRRIQLVSATLRLGVDGQAVVV